MYAQELMRAKGLKERQTGLSFLIIAIIHIQSLAVGTGERGEIAAVNRGWAGMARHSELGGARAAAVNRGERAIHQWRGGGSSYLFTTLTHNRYLVEAPGYGWAYAIRHSLQ